MDETPMTVRITIPRDTDFTDEAWQNCCDHLRERYEHVEDHHDHVTIFNLPVVLELKENHESH
jgi:hypothetical protein